MIPAASIPALDHLGNVPATYRHEWKVATAVDTLVLPGRVFKWYHVHSVGVPVAPTLDAEARGVLLDAAQGGAWAPEYGLNFALLHVASTHAFLIAGVWRGHNELWERGYYKPVGSDDPFKRTELAGEDAPTMCVWELAVLCHERMAWHRYLFSAKTTADKHVWLADTYTGQA